MSIKGLNRDTFEKITGINGDYFQFQKTAVTLLSQPNFKNSAHFVLMDLKEFNGIVTDIEDLTFENTEIESLRYYSGTKQRMMERKISI